MSTVWKFQVAIDDVPTAIEMPELAEVVHVDSQAGGLWLWALVVPDRPSEIRRFVVHGTGHSVPHSHLYVGTVQMGPLVWHVFEVAA
jgi:hypothetical protein